MRICAIVLGALAATASAALAQTPPAPTPIPAAPAVANTPSAPLPKIVQPKPSRRVAHRPHGQPIVKGNTDVFVDSYGQLSTTMQP